MANPVLSVCATCNFCAKRFLGTDTRIYCEVPMIGFPVAVKRHLLTLPNTGDQTIVQQVPANCPHMAEQEANQ